MQSTNLKKLMVFIDGSNLLGGWWAYCKRNNYITDSKSKKEAIIKFIDYEKLLLEITKDTDFIRGYFYDAVQEPIDDKKQKFFDKLRTLQITIVTKRLRYKNSTCKHCGVQDVHIPYQKGVDVSLVTEFMSLAVEKAFDMAYIISGDNDFVDAVNFVKSKGLKVIVVSFMDNLGDDLMRSADSVIVLDKLFERICKN